MKISSPFYKKQFKSMESKQAYLKACKWIARNVIGKVEAKDVTFTINKVEGECLPTFELILYCQLEEKEYQKQHCEKCKEFHQLFYLNQQFNCNSCSMKGYVDSLAERMKRKSSWKKERLAYACKVRDKW